MTKLAIFDLDGTLINTIADLGTAVNHALALKNLPGHDMETYLTMVGRGVRKLVADALCASMGEKPQDSLVDSCLADFTSYYMEHIDVLTRPYPGVLEVVKRLDAEGWMLAVASNKFQAGTEKLVGGMFPGIPWVAVFGNREGKPLKPDTALVDEIVGLAEQRAAGKVDKIVYIGDSETDMKTAQNAGLPAVAVTWGFRTREELEAAGAVNFADTAEEMYELIVNLK